MRPVLSDLGDVAPDLNRMLIELGPFSEAGIPAVKSLGDASEIGIPAMRDALPVTKDLRRLAKVAKPVGETAAAVLESVEARAAASSACSTTPSTRWPPSTASTRSATTCARA